MLMFSMTASADGFVTDPNDRIDWTAPDDELFAFHLARVRTLGGTLIGRRLYETMLPWETDPSMRSSPLSAEFADVWTALPKVVFSRSFVETQGNARQATEPLDDEIRAMATGTGKDLEIGGATLAGQAFILGLIDEVRLFRAPIVLGGGTPFFPSRAPETPMTLLETRKFGDAVIYERYAVDRPDLEKS